MFQVNLALLKIAELFRPSISQKKLLVRPDPNLFPGPVRFLFPVHQNIWKFQITKFAFNFTKWEPHNYQNTVCLKQNPEIVQFCHGINLAESLLELVVSLKAQIQMLKWVKFIYSGKATKFWEISTLLLSYAVLAKSKVKISQNQLQAGNTRIHTIYMHMQWYILFGYVVLKFLMWTFSVLNG
jgi:hypothetical protein